MIYSLVNNAAVGLVLYFGVSDFSVSQQLLFICKVSHLLVQMHTAHITPPIPATKASEATIIYTIIQSTKKDLDEKKLHFLLLLLQEHTGTDTISNRLTEVTIGGLRVIQNAKFWRYDSL